MVERAGGVEWCSSYVQRMQLGLVEASGVTGSRSPSRWRHKAMPVRFQHGRCVDGQLSDPRRWARKSTGLSDKRARLLRFTLVVKVEGLLAVSAKCPDRDSSFVKARLTPAW